MYRNRLSTGAYLLAAVLALLALLDLVTAVAEGASDGLFWSIAVSGLDGRGLTAPALALLVVSVTAVSTSDRRVLRMTAIGSGVLAAALLLLLPPFILDAGRLYASVPEAERTATVIRALAGFGNCAIGLAIASLFSYFARWAARNVGLVEQPVEAHSPQVRGMLVVPNPGGAGSRVWVSTDTPFPPR